jgi:hypothetical protein
LKRRHQAGCNSGENRDAECKAEHPSVDVKVRGARYAAQSRRSYNIEPPVGDKQAENGAEKSEHQRFGNHQANNPVTACAERFPDTQFTAAGAGFGKQQISDIDARN